MYYASIRAYYYSVIMIPRINPVEFKPAPSIFNVTFPS